VEQITVYGSKVTAEHVGWKYEPQGLTSAQLNLPYCIATLLLDGDVFVDQFTEELVADPERMRVATKVTVLEDPAITALGSKFRHKVRVKLRLKDSTLMEETVEAGRGNEHNFASEADIVEKFSKLATHVMPKGKVERICDWMLHLEKQADAGELARLLGT